MTPKEKALELIEKFKIDNYDWIALGYLSSIKECAFIVADEILKITYKRRLINGIEANEYWHQVKIEIQAFS